MRQRRGFTLIELLVVIAIIVLLMAMLLPAIQKVRAAVDRMRCASNIRQLAIAAHDYHNDFHAFPPGVRQYLFAGAPKYRGYTLFVYLLPYFEQDLLYHRWDFATPLNNVSGGSLAPTATVIKLLLCPSEALPQNPVVDSNGFWYGLTSYGGNGGTRSYQPISSTVDGIFHTTGPGSEPKPNQDVVKIADIVDGTSNTLLFGERNHDDPNYDTFAAAGLTQQSFMENWGWWAATAGRLSAGHVTMSGFVPINYQIPFRYGDPGAPSTQPGFQPYEDMRICAWGSKHPGGANFSFGDGSTRFLHNNLDLAVLQALSTRRGGENIIDDF